MRAKKLEENNRGQRPLEVKEVLTVIGEILKHQLGIQRGINAKMLRRNIT